MTNSRPEDLYEIKGDVPDPAGSGARGVSAEVDLTKTAIGHPRIRYGDRITTPDVYAADGELFLHLYCPRCSNALRITDKMKAIRFQRNDRTGGEIDIEEFRCTWDGCGLHVRVERNQMIDV
ncbi:MAG: hypothetical protein ACYSWU_00070 [Planctomycetota bacterium]|jgi:hypothetical protein